MASIYALCDPLDGQVRYVGCTSLALPARLALHCRDARSKSRKVEWISSLTERPTIVLLLEVGDEEKYIWERSFVAVYRELGVDLLNSTEGGRGRGFTAEERKQQAEAMRGNQYGKGRRPHPHTDESRAKIAAANSRRVWTPEMRARASEAAKRRNQQKAEV